MLYDPLTYEGIKGGTKFNYDLNPGKQGSRQKIVDEPSVSSCKKIKVEDRLMEFEKKRKLKILQLKEENFNKENYKSITRQPSH